MSDSVYYSIWVVWQVMYVVQFPITGIAMLFSAGTFLYVSTVHVLNELIQGHTSEGRTGSSSKLSNLELLLLTTGALLPVTFSIFHSH